jgi:hypothetical protein
VVTLETSIAVVSCFPHRYHFAKTPALNKVVAVPPSATVIWSAYGGASLISIFRFSKSYTTSRFGRVAYNHIRIDKEYFPAMGQNLKRLMVDSVPAIKDALESYN